MTGGRGFDSLIASAVPLILFVFHGTCSRRARAFGGDEMAPALGEAGAIQRPIRRILFIIG
jgi:hypothetical protein